MTQNAKSWVCLNASAQINLEIVNYFVNWLAAFLLCHNFRRVLLHHQVIHYFKVNLCIHIQAVHDKMRI